jgi:hypothetical protein
VPGFLNSENICIFSVLEIQDRHVVAAMNRLVSARFNRRDEPVKHAIVFFEPKHPWFHSPDGP